MTHTEKRSILSEKITRIEGTGSIDVELEGKRVNHVNVNIFEGPRLVEELIVGKSIEEVISIVPRICAICNLSHRLASTTAMKKASLIELPDPALLFQRLMHMGEMIESHTLHLYLLVLPDFFKVPSAIHLLDDHGTTVIEGLMQKKFGNKIMRLAGGDRMIHGENPQTGGFGKYPSISDLDELIEESKELLPTAIKIVDVVGQLEIPDFASAPTEFMCVDPPDNQFGFYGDHIITSTGKRVASEDYHKIITERVVPHSYAKRALHEGQPFTVGAMARILLLKDRLRGNAGKLFDKYYVKDWELNPLYNNMAQTIENVYSMEQVSIYAEKLKKYVDDEIPLVPAKQTSGRGVGTVEAPRGLLIHDYTIDKGLLTKGNIITPTAMNLDDIERHLKISAENQLTTDIVDEDIRFNLEMAVRAYDPCISCSAHLVKIKRRGGDQLTLNY